MPFIDDDLLWCPDNDGRMVDLSCLVSKLHTTFSLGGVWILFLFPFEQTTAQNGQQAAMHVQMNHGEFSSDLTELSHADLNGLVSEIDDGEGDDIFKQFGNFELDNIFAEFDEKVLKLIK